MQKKLLASLMVLVISFSSIAHAGGFTVCLMGMATAITGTTTGISIWAAASTKNCQAPKECPAGNSLHCCLWRTDDDGDQSIVDNCDATPVDTSCGSAGRLCPDPRAWTCINSEYTAFFSGSQERCEVPTGGGCPAYKGAIAGAVFSTILVVVSGAVFLGEMHKWRKNRQVDV